MAIVRKIVEIESLLFSIQFPAYSSLFFKDSLDPNVQIINMPNAPRFYIGPLTKYL